MSTDAIFGRPNAFASSAIFISSSGNGESGELLGLGEHNDVPDGAGYNANTDSQHHQHDAVDEVTGLGHSERHQKHQNHWKEIRHKKHPTESDTVSQVLLADTCSQMSSIVRAISVLHQDWEGGDREYAEKAILTAQDLCSKFRVQTCTVKK